MSLGRRALLLSASATLHAAAVSAALVIAGTGSGTMLFVDLAGVDLIAGSDDVPSQSSSPAAAPPKPTPAAHRIVRAPRALAAATPPAASEMANVPPTPPAPPRFEVSREAAPSEGTTPAAAEPSAASGQTAGAGEPGSAGPSGGASSVLRDGGGLAGSGGALLALAASGEGRSSVPAEYGPYLARFRQRLQEALVYPLAARRQGLSGSVELEVLVEPSGQIRSVRLLSSSSHAVLDAAALDTVRALAPLPLPEHLPRRPLKIRLPVVFHLN
ncbi:MAG TPA: energy transducer TonB [Methylomirabilota bacterium]|nr:energy transducer TonB [Methylomirabilota bacterium]